MVIIHVQLHTIFVWATGFLNSPFDVDYYKVALFLIDKQSNFDALLDAGHNVLAAIIAIFPNIVNAILFILCLSFISSKKIQEKKYFYYFLYWFMIMNFGQIYSCIFRSFELPGDIQVFAKGLNISFYWIFIPGILFIIYGVSVILIYKIPQAYKILKIIPTFNKAIFLFISIFILFGYFGGFVYDIIAKKYIYLIYPISLVTLFFLICYPSNRWVQNRVQKL
jgi:hypothetical protein